MSAPRTLSMRVWLAVVLGLLVATTAAAVAAVFVERFGEEFEDRAGSIAVGYSVDAAGRISRAADVEAVQSVTERASSDVPLALFAFAADGTLLTSARSHGIPLELVPSRSEALASALAGRRYVETANDGTGTVVALPVRSGPAAAVVAYASHPELEAGLGLARSKITEAALWGVLAGGLAGILVAALIARRLSRIAGAAAAIEARDFARPVRASFPDEVGALAASLDRMRLHLREAFTGLASERDRLRRLLERLHDGVITVTPSGTVEFANEAAARILAPAEIDEGAPIPEPWSGVRLGALAADLFRPDATVAHARVEEGERTIAVVGIPARGADTAMLVLEDVSEQERRQRAEREFVANAAHELRTPLQTVLGAVEALRAGAEEEPVERRRFLELIEREGRRLGRLTRALLVLARAQRGTEQVALAPVRVRPLLEEVAGGVEAPDGVSVQVSCPPGLEALADRDLLEQALANLAANAANHTEAGTIRLAASPAPPAGVAIDVSDTGPGIPAHARERLFDRFYRGDGRGDDRFGLGLAIARESARALGGDVRLEDAPGGGTLARVLLVAPREDAR